MRSFIRNILLGAGALFAAGVVADDCEGGPWDETVWMGRPQDDPAGNYFCDTKWKQGLVVTGVTIWAEKYHIKGLRFKYSDGSEGDLHGQATGNPDWTPAAPKNSLTWREDETLRAVKMWNNWNDGNGPDAVGRIEVSVGEVKLEVSSDVGDTSKSDNRGTEIPLNSGVLLGARGKQGQWVESLELLFLSDKVVSSTLIDMELGSSLEEWNAKQK